MICIGAGLRVKAIMDLGIGLDTAQPDCQALLPWKSGDMFLSLELENGAWVTLRASGTEPKLKYYLEARAAGKGQSCTLADALESACLSELIQPGCYGLETQSVR
jgi:phosphomannomutase